MFPFENINNETYKENKEKKIDIILPIFIVKLLIEKANLLQFKTL